MSQITYSFVKCGRLIYFFPHFRNTDMSRYGYLEVFQSLLEFEITRVDCMSKIKALRVYFRNSGVEESILQIYIYQKKYTKTVFE